MAQSRILIVEDDLDTSKLLDDMLTENGYYVDIVSLGEDALKALKEDKYDLILVDILLPKTDGRALCKEIRKDPRLKDVKIIYISILDYNEYVERYEEKDFKKLNIDGYITKPFKFSKVLETVAKAISAEK